MSNLFGQESVSISKPCELCGLPMARTGKKYHPDCKKVLSVVRRRMQRTGGDLNHTEAEWRWMEVKAHVEWLLSQPNVKVKRVVGEKGENALLAFRIHLRRPA